MTYTARVIFKAGTRVDIRDRLTPIAVLTCAPGVQRAVWVRLEAPVYGKYMKSLEGVLFQACGLLNPDRLREAQRR